MPTLSERWDALKHNDKHFDKANGRGNSTVPCNCNLSKLKVLFVYIDESKTISCLPFRNWLPIFGNLFTFSAVYLQQILKNCLVLKGILALPKVF